MPSSVAHCFTWTPKTLSDNTGYTVDPVLRDAITTSGPFIPVVLCPWVDPMRMVRWWACSTRNCKSYHMPDISAPRFSSEGGLESFAFFLVLLLAFTWLRYLAHWLDKVASQCCCQDIGMLSPIPNSVVLQPIHHAAIGMPHSGPWIEFP